MTHASFALRVGDLVPMLFVKPVAFYHHIPQEYYHQGCALCEEELTPSDEAMLLTCEVSNLSYIVAEKQTTATVSAMLESRPVIGMAHNTCILAERFTRQTALDANFSVLKQAFPYYKYLTQLFAYDSRTDRGYVRVESEHRSLVLRTRDQWEQYQSVFPNVDPPTWIHCTLITAFACAISRLPIWNIKVPSDTNVDKYITNVKRCMKISQAWDDSVTMAKLSGSVCAMTSYPIIDCARIK